MTESTDTLGAELSRLGREFTELVRAMSDGQTVGLHTARVVQFAAG